MKKDDLCTAAQMCESWSRTRRLFCVSDPIVAMWRQHCAVWQLWQLWQCVAMCVPLCHWCQLPPPGVNNVAWQPRPVARPGSHTLAVVMSAVPPPVQCRSEMGGCWRLQPASLTTLFYKSITFSVRYIKILSWECVSNNMVPQLTSRL